MSCASTTNSSIWITAFAVSRRCRGGGVYAGGGLALPQPGRASVLYKDLVEILVRTAHKYHALESPAQRFVRLVEGDILPKTAGAQVALPVRRRGGLRGFLAGVGANDAALRASSTGLRVESTEVGARDLLRLLLSKGGPTAPEPAAEIKEEEDGEKDEGGGGGEKGGGGGATGQRPGTRRSRRMGTKSQRQRRVGCGRGRGERKRRRPRGGGEEAERAASPGAGLALKCIHVANVGSGETGEIFEAGTGKVIGIFDAAVTISTPSLWTRWRLRNQALRERTSRRSLGRWWRPGRLRKLLEA